MTGEREDILRAFAMGDLERDAALRALADDAEGLDRLRELEQLDGLFAGARDEEARVLSELETPEPEQQAALDRFRAQVLFRDPPRPGIGRMQRLLPWAAAATLLLCAALWLRGGRGNEPRVVQPLGSELCEFPVGEVTEVSDLRWRAFAPPGGWYQVRVYATGAKERTLILERTRVQGLQWELTPAEIETVREAGRIEWTVESYIGGNRGAQRGTASAWLSP